MHAPSKTLITSEYAPQASTSVSEASTSVSAASLKVMSRCFLHAVFLVEDVLQGAYHGKICAISPAVQSRHHDLVVGRRNVWRVGYQVAGVYICRCSKEAGVVDLQTQDRA